MLREATFENFKPFASPQAAKFGRITLVYGPNSSGKSSLIQALMLLRQSLQGQSPGGTSLITQGEFVNLGSLKSLLYKHELSRELVISLTFDCSGRLRPGPSHNRLPADRERKVTIRFRAAPSRGYRKKDSSEIASVRYQLLSDPPFDVTLERKSEKDRRFPWWATFVFADEASAKAMFSRYLSTEKGSDWRRDRIVESWLAAVKNEEPEIVESQLKGFIEFIVKSKVRPIGFLPDTFEPTDEVPDSVTQLMGSFRTNRPTLLRLGTPISMIAKEYYEAVGSVSYLGPLRSHPARHYLVSGGIKDSVGVRGENTPQVIFGQRRQIERTINWWFDKFEIPHQLRVKSVGNEVTGQIVVLTLVDRRNRVPVAPSDVGFGIGQLLPIIVEGLVSKARVLCVEQPEIHLHPKLQAHVADLLIETAGLGSFVPHQPNSDQSNNQWVIESHSEALMLRFQRRIREGMISPADVSVLYVEPTKDGSRILQLKLDESGAFQDEWPGGFFEETYVEAFGGVQ